MSETGHDGWGSTNAFSEGLGPVTDLTDMDGDIRVLGGGSDREGMPLELGNVRDLEEEPLAGGVLEAGLDNPEFHGARRVDEDLAQPGRAASTDFTVHALTEIDDARPNGTTPGEIPETDVGIVEGEGVREGG